MIKRLLSFALILSIVSLSGCGDITKLNSVKKIAIAGITFKKSYVEVDNKGNEIGGVDLLSLDLTSGKIEFFAINKDVKHFYTDVTNRLIKVFQSEGFEIILAPSFKENDIFKSLQFQENLDDYNLKPYTSGLFSQDIEKTTALSESLDVDAVGYLNLSILKIDAPGLFGIPGKKLGLRGQLNLVHRDGTTIIGHQVFQVETDGAVDLVKFFLGPINNVIQINDESRETYEQLKGRFLTKIENLLKSRN